MKRLLRRVQHTFGVVLAWSLLVACSFQSGLPQLSADQIKQRSADSMTALQSLHFMIELSGDLTYIDPAGLLALKRAEGDIVTPDRVQATIRTRTLGTTTDLGVVGVGTTQWARNPLSGRWETLPPEYGSFDIAALFSGERGVVGLLRDVPLSAEPQETLSGRPHYVLSTTTTGQQLTAMTSGMITSGNVAVKLYVDGTSFLLSRIELTELDTDPEEPTYWQITLSAFDQPVTIAPPVTQ